ncbi:two-component sensor histidine kinase, partial [Micromonospora sp. M51]|nr:two-component sensor histidine kinase [Micromonospora sp. M51]
MEWAVAVVVVVALVAGMVAGLLLPRFLPRRDDRSASTGSVSFRWNRGRPAIADEQQAGLGRRTIDSLRAGVVVLD